MSDHEDMRGASRDWFWARIVLIGGFSVAILVAAFFVWRGHEEKVAEQQAEQAAAAKQQKAEQDSSKQQQTDANAKAGMMLCAMELVNAKNLGIIPPFGQLASMMPQVTKTRGRYMCIAATQALKYVIQADLMCRDLVNPKCVRVVNIATDDGTKLYSSR